MKSVIEYMENGNVETQTQQTWFDIVAEKIAEIIEEERAEINLNFPLSGGEERLHIYKDEKPAKAYIWTSFLQDLETEFPLSGGEIER
jgi:hypothetical protein